VFVTALIGRLTFATGEVALGDAGHMPALVIGAAAPAAIAQVPKCMALGVIEDTPYSEGRFTLVPGEALVLYTDGVTDARNVAGELFGADRLTGVVEQLAGQPAEAMAAGISHALNAFEGGAAPEDDLTLLVLRYRGS
jgi:sigma-B regulation protein RsbU (phosphoserine phosphatase)